MVKKKEELTYWEGFFSLFLIVGLGLALIIVFIKSILFIKEITDIFVSLFTLGIFFIMIGFTGLILIYYLKDDC